MATVKRKKTSSEIASKTPKSKVVEAKLALKAETDNERKARQRDGKVGLGAFTSFLDSAIAFSQKYDNPLEFELVYDVLSQWSDLCRRSSQHWAISLAKLEKSAAPVVVQYEQRVEKLYLRP